MVNFQNLIAVIKRNVSRCTEHQWHHAQQQFKFSVFRKGMILLIREDRFFSQKGKSSPVRSNYWNRFVVCTWWGPHPLVRTSSLLLSRILGSRGQLKRSRIFRGAQERLMHDFHGSWLLTFEFPQGVSHISA